MLLCAPQALFTTSACGPSWCHGPTAQSGTARRTAFHPKSPHCHLRRNALEHRTCAATRLCRRSLPRRLLTQLASTPAPTLSFPATRASAAIHKVCLICASSLAMRWEYKCGMTRRDKTGQSNQQRHTAPIPFCCYLGLLARSRLQRTHTPLLVSTTCAACEQVPASTSTMTPPSATGAAASCTARPVWCGRAPGPPVPLTPPARLITCALVTSCRVC